MKNNKDLLQDREKIVFRKLQGKTKLNTFLINGNSYLKVYENSIKNNILKILENLKISDRLAIKELIEKTKKQEVISVYNEVGFLQKAGIIELKDGIIILKRKIKSVKK